MYYLIQSNIYSDPDHARVFRALSELGLEYKALELTTKAENILANTPRKDIFVYGSVRLARLAKAQTEWYPGSFYGGNHRFEIHSQHYQNHLLNFHTQVFAFGEAITWKPNESKFIKPYQDAKVFTGKVFTEIKWKDFVQHSLENPTTPLLHAQTLVQASEYQKLIKEARVWIIGGKVIAGLYYKYHGDVPFEAEVAPEGLEFAQAMANLYQVAPAFVMDIGLTYEGWKIVEINCINSAGLYHLNPSVLFRALEAYF